MSTDRRAQLVTGAIDLIATSGIRALTHRALDSRLGLPLGSASYYFRTRQALIEAVADGITARSRADFAAMRERPGSLGKHAAQTGLSRQGGHPDDIARGVAGWLDRLLDQRRNELIARQALIVEVLADPPVRSRLAGSLFSLDRATELCTALGAVRPRDSAGDFLALLEGLVFDRLAGTRADLPTGTPDSVEQLTRPLSIFLTAVADSAASDQAPAQPNSE
ncbi:transcriptional regulator [Nocardia sp. NPDC050718]|uniref:TetR/AcrR family transcriptional regulator n=1 Tax=Nocardia sp. NPDC050718 TaxID=3155788 RepID=UPI0033F502D3